MFATITVTSVDDSVADGDGVTLREAIAAANSNSPVGDAPAGDPVATAVDVIEFNITAGSGVRTIVPVAQLPIITESVTINGYSQPGASANTLAVGSDAKLLIEIDGTNAFGSSGLVITGGGTTIRGLVVNRFEASGIQIATGDINNTNNVIAGNFIGTNADGDSALGNNQNGIFIVSAANNTVGGTAPADRNLISGNSTGVSLINNVVERSTGNKVIGNYIGTDAAGIDAIPNTADGVSLSASDNFIGGTEAGAGNLISGNTGRGVLLDTASRNAILGNFIGVKSNGNQPLGNNVGITVAVSESVTIGQVGAPNIISGNTQEGVFISLSEDIKVIANRIGTNAAGTLPIGNQKDGVLVANAEGTTIGGLAAGEGNLISGNNANGVQVFGGFSDNNRVLGNFIGTDVTGNAKIPNLASGVLVDTPGGTFIGGTADGSRNIISGNGADGVRVTLNGGNFILGNYIGTNAAGTAPLGNSDNGVNLGSTLNTVGGAAAGARNVISGNGADGVAIFAESNTIKGNYIGTDATGTADVGNQRTGILVGEDLAFIGGAQPGEGNLISGNSAGGIELGADGADVFGNRIGTNAAGTGPLPNELYGIGIFGDLNRIGGLNAGEGNVIAFTSGTGVYVAGTLDGEDAETALFNPILSNSIFSNGQLGIDLDSSFIPTVNGDGPTTNDGEPDDDKGGNNLQNYPVLTSAVASGIQTSVIGSLTSDEEIPYLIQFFADPLGDPSGFGEGRVLMGSIFVTTTIAGVANFAADLPVAIAAGQRVSATATRQVDTNFFTDTSEFSKWVTVTGPPPQISVSDVTVTEGNNVPATAAFTISLSGASSAPTTVTFTTSDGTAKQPDDYLSQTQTVTFNPGETSKTVNVTVNPDATAEGTETFVVTLSNAVNGPIIDGQGVGTILNDVVAPPTGPPTLAVNDVAITEGNSATKTLTFTVTRSGNTTGNSTVKFNTSNNTAGEGDYVAGQTGTLSFGAGRDHQDDQRRDQRRHHRRERRDLLPAPFAGHRRDDLRQPGRGTILNDDTAPSRHRP